MRIVLVRHGKPTYQAPTTLRLDQLDEAVDRYNLSPLDSRVLPPPSTLETVAQTGFVLASDLPRSIDSVSMLTSREPKVDPVFREAEIPTRLPFPGGVRLFPLGWVVVARMFWFCGWSGDSEPVRSARRRARKACDYLSEMASLHGSVSLLGHQMFNILIARELRSRGWHGPVIPPFPHWSLATYTQ